MKRVALLNSSGGVITTLIQEDKELIIRHHDPDVDVVLEDNARLRNEPHNSKSSFRRKASIPRGMIYQEASKEAARRGVTMFEFLCRTPQEEIRKWRNKVIQEHSKLRTA